MQLLLGSGARVLVPKNFPFLTIVSSNVFITKKVLGNLHKARR